MRFGEGVVVRVAATVRPTGDAGVGQPLGVAHRQVLRAAVAVMHQVARAVTATIVDLAELKRIEDEVRAERSRHAPSDNASRETSMTKATS